MNKWLKVLLIFLGIVVLAFFVARFTDALMWYTMPTPANEPTLKTGTTVVASSFKSPKRGNFIVFKNAVSDSFASLAMDEKHHGDLYIKRLCGMPGDIIEMKDGELFVNHLDFDANYDLDHNYFISSKDQGLFEETDMPRDDQIRTNPGNDSMIVPLSKTLYDKYKNRIHIKKVLSPEATIWNQPGSESKAWTIDNFGPLIVPEGFYLVLGDNRHNSLDSRYVGFIKKSDCKATVLFK